MKAKTKRRKPVDKKTRETLSRNVKRRRDERFASSRSKNVALAQKAGISLSRVQDVVNQSVGASIDTVARIARALDCSVADLFSEDIAQETVEIKSLWSDTDDFGRSNILQTARSWHEARPRGKSDGR